MKNDLLDLSSLDAMRDHPVSGQIDEIFRNVIKENKVMQKKAEEAAAAASDPGELSLEEVGELDIGLDLGADEAPSAPVDEGMELSLDGGESLDLGDAEFTGEEANDEGYGDLSLDGGEEELAELPEGEGDGEAEGFGELSLSEDEEVPAQDEDSIENIGELSFDDLGGDTATATVTEVAPDLPDELSLGGLDLGDEELNLGGDEPPATLDDEEGLSLDLSAPDDESSNSDLSDDALEKLKEIDAIMEFDASQIHLRPPMPQAEVEEEDDGLAELKDLNQPLVSEDLNLDSINFSAEDDEEEEEKPAPKEEKKKKKKEAEPVREAAAIARNIGEDLKEISGAYSGEMERMQATIANLRGDRDELLAKIQKLEDEKVLQSRQGLSVRAELDERKIELTIIRKKLNEEITDLKDRLKLYDEKRLILEEKNRILLQELDKAAQKNKIDVKKVQMRERELEQKLELLKSDAETQIRHRDLKILELKRKIDAMEFDMESISQQEKRSVESRYELEDKLDKAIKTLRGAISVLEDESDRSNALNALKKNIDM